MGGVDVGVLVAAGVFVRRGARDGVLRLTSVPSAWVVDVCKVASGDDLRKPPKRYRSTGIVNLRRSSRRECTHPAVSAAPRHKECHLKQKQNCPEWSIHTQSPMSGLA